MRLHRVWGDKMNLAEIMDSVSPLWGICPFAELESELIACRAKSRLPDFPQSVIVACFPYLLGNENYIDSNISKYAAVPDYHAVVTARLNSACEKLAELYPNESFAPFADNSPVPEVRAACAAGLGVRGMNSLLITEKYGSYVFIGEIVTTLQIPCEPAKEKPCLGCGKCLEACPSGALSRSGFDKSKCLSEITQRKGELTDSEKNLMLECGCVWGCDICQDVCPMNKDAAVTEINEFLSSPVARISSCCEIKGRAYEWRGRKVIERNIALFEERKENTQ